MKALLCNAIMIIGKLCQTVHDCTAVQLNGKSIGHEIISCIQGTPWLVYIISIYNSLIIPSQQAQETTLNWEKTQIY